MDKRRLWKLIGAPGLAVTSLLFVFLLLGWHKAGATQDGDGTASGIGSPGAAFTVSGTVVCGATGPISDVQVSVWDRMKSTVVTSDTTDHSGAYSVMLDEDTYLVEFIPTVAAGLNAKGFTTMEIVTNSALNVDFCTCSGVWLSETIDSEDAGASQSLALESTYPYTPHVAYYAGVGNLEYAWLSGTTWITERVDSGGLPELALVPAKPHTPCIAYSSGGSWLTKFAYRLDATTWVSMTIFDWRSGERTASLALEPTSPYRPHMCYYVPFGNDVLMHSYPSGTSWTGSGWVHEIVEHRPGVCCWMAVEQTSPYTPHISYALDGDLKHAWKRGTTWISETVDTGVGCCGRTSLALDSSGNPQISYCDRPNRDLKYAWKHGTDWFTETVDSEGMVGDWPSLALDSRGNPHVSYYGETSGVKYARFDGTLWIIQATYEGWGVSSLALDRMDCPHISYYNAIEQDLKYAYIPPCRVYLPRVMRNYVR